VDVRHAAGGTNGHWRVWFTSAIWRSWESMPCRCLPGGGNGVAGRAARLADDGVCRGGADWISSAKCGAMSNRDGRSPGCRWRFSRSRMSATAELHGATSHPPRQSGGLTAVASLIAVVKMGDTGAYTVGRLFGRHKMTPRLSPGKTWEGVAGAILFAAFAGWIVLRLLPGAVGGPSVAFGSIRESFGRWQWIAYGIIVGIAGLLGRPGRIAHQARRRRKDSSPGCPASAVVGPIGLDSVRGAGGVDLLGERAGVNRSPLLALRALCHEPTRIDVTAIEK